MMLKYDRAPISNRDRQRAFRARNPGYRNRYRTASKPVDPAFVPIPPEVPVPADAVEPRQEEKPIDLSLAGLAM